ncbi:MAG: hypothetical protein OEV41_11265 [Gammaproteobacteria bacterium]|nr:hypothetical protein [Gammaproteobacteria bacterium]
MSHHTAPSRFALAMLLGLAAMYFGPMLAHAGEPELSKGEVLTIEDAIDVAKRCVLERNIRLVGSFIESARFDRNPRGDRGPFWLVTWAYSREIKGGQVFVTIFVDRTCELTFGE